MKPKKTDFKRILEGSLADLMASGTLSEARNAITRTLMLEIGSLNNEIDRLSQSFLIPASLSDIGWPEGTYITEKNYKELLVFVHNDQKIKAIKCLRAATNLGLQESKELVGRIMDCENPLPEG